VTEEQEHQSQNSKETSYMLKTVSIGFVGGVFWSFLNYIAYLFHFTEISPNVILQPWALGEWKEKAMGNFVSMIILGIISIVVAILYQVTLKNYMRVWIGMLFGLVLWVLVFYVLNPLFPDIKTVSELDKNTIITSICFYILYGVFVGYSISFEASALNLKDSDQATVNEE